MSNGQKLKQRRQALSRFLAYVLGRRPDEFGLAPDEEGFIPVKDLLAALQEEEGWTFVRQSHLEDLILDPDRVAFEVSEKNIRVAPADTELEIGPHPEVTPPRFLYYGARRKAYPVILQNGITPGGRPQVVLSATEDLARRIARRRDPEPVLLTVLAEEAHQRGQVFRRPQELIFLTDQIPPDLFTGPPLPKEKPVSEKKKKADPPPAPKYPGSYFVDPERDLEPIGRGHKDWDRKQRGDVPDWKRATRKERRRRKPEEE